MKNSTQPAKQNFRHESLQDTETIQQLLDALTRGIGRGELTFSDEDGEMVMQPNDLINLKLTASREDGRNRVTIRITWLEDESNKKGEKSLKIR